MPQWVIQVLELDDSTGDTEHVFGPFSREDAIGITYELQVRGYAAEYVLLEHLPILPILSNYPPGAWQDAATDWICEVIK